MLDQFCQRPSSGGNSSGLVALEGGEGETMLNQKGRFDQTVLASRRSALPLLHFAGVAGVLPGRDIPGVRIDNQGIADLMSGVAEVLDERRADHEVLLSSPNFPEERMGVLARRVLDRKLSVTDLAILAARRVLERSALGAENIGTVIVSTVSAESVVPAVATSVCAALGLPERVLAFDLTLGCNGFMAALAIAQGCLSAGAGGGAALGIGAEAMSRVLDASDRTSLPIFGDGAGAVLLTEEAAAGSWPVEIYTLGKGGPRIRICPVETDYPLMRMTALGGYCVPGEERTQRLRVELDGQRVYRDMLRTLPDRIRSYLARFDVSLDAIDHFAFHQANERLVRAVAEILGVEPKRVLSNIASVGNTTSASIPLLLDDAERRGDLRAGECVLLVGFGTGYSIGMVLVQWP